MTERSADAAAPPAATPPPDNAEPLLPPLDQDCPDCTGAAGQAMRAANTALWVVWNEEEAAAFDKFVEDNGQESGWRWPDSQIHKEIYARKPDEMPPTGCVECDFSGRVATAAGQQIIAFLANQARRD